jgi:hypothetical protein
MMTEQMTEKRKLLRTISNAALQSAETFNIDTDSCKVNDLIMLFAYNPDKKHRFNSFMGWKYEGYTVKKGAKAYLVWGQPLNRDRVDKVTGQAIDNNRDNETDPPFFPVSFLFRDDQVHKIEAGTKKAGKDNKAKQTTEITETIDIDF